MEEGDGWSRVWARRRVCVEREATVSSITRTGLSIWRPTATGQQTGVQVSVSTGERAHTDSSVQDNTSECAHSSVQTDLDPSVLFKERSRQVCQNLWFIKHVCSTLRALIRARTTWCRSHACPRTLQLAWPFYILQFVWTVHRSKNRGGCASLLVRPAQWLPLVFHYQVAMGLPLLGFCHLWIQGLHSAKLGYSACGCTADSCEGRRDNLNPQRCFLQIKYQLQINVCQVRRRRHLLAGENVLSKLQHKQIPER